jgi:hypothetical protein
VRRCKAHPALWRLSPKAAFKRIEGIFRRWRRDRRKQGDDWLHWLGVGREDAEVDFLACWDKIRFLPGLDPLECAVELAGRKPLALKPEIEARRSAGYPRFVSVAGWLQVAMRDRPIQLPVEALAQHLRCEPMTISRYRQWAIEDSYLQLVKAHEFRGKGRPGRATEFRFAVGKWECLKRSQ